MTAAVVVGAGVRRRAVRAGSRARSGRSPRGSVTAELALALPGVVLILAMVLATGRVVTAQLQCVDAARAAARQAARGEQPATVAATATTAGPDGARVGVRYEGAAVVVDVSAVVSLAVPGLPGVTVRSRAAAEVEQP